MVVLREETLVARLAVRIALAYGVNPEIIGQLRVASILHDIGKLKIPDSIVNKPGKFDDREFEIMKTHTRLGAELLRSMKGELGEMARMVAMYHHEWHNGKGYWGKSAYELPDYVPIVSISDVYIALISKRPYKPAWHPRDALSYIRQQTGMQFAPALVETFLSVAGDFL